MRSSLVFRSSGCQCTSCNGSGFDPSIRRYSGIWGAADEAVLNIVRKKSPPKIFLKRSNADLQILGPHLLMSHMVSHVYVWPAVFWNKPTQFYTCSLIMLRSKHSSSKKTTLEDVCLDLFIVRKHVYNCNRLFQTANHIHVDVRTCAVYMERALDEKERKESTRWRMSSLLLPLHHVFLSLEMAPHPH